MEFLVFILAAIIGSFLNVCIHRIPAGQSIAFPPSNCPHCSAAIRPWDNIPIVSYVLLRGRCRQCKEPISIRYPLVEALTGAAGVATYLFFGPTPQALLFFAFLCALIVITFIDLDHQIIPDVISLPGILIGLTAAFLPGAPDWLESLLGIVIGGGVLWAIAEGYFRLTGREGMGGGDVKLLAMIGAFLGWQAIPVTLMVASLSGTLLGLALMLRRGEGRQMAIPFGPFLAAGAVVALFAGEPLMHWYLNLTRL
jgi:leader peptidase (prepilin peptidase) / N-methyltransferase